MLAQLLLTTRKDAEEAAALTLGVAVESDSHSRTTGKRLGELWSKLNTVQPGNGVVCDLGEALSARALLPREESV